MKTKMKKEAIASALLGICGVTAIALAGGDGQHTCTACHPTQTNICDEVECASNEDCGARWSGTGQNATVRALCVRQ